MVSVYLNSSQGVLNRAADTYQSEVAESLLEVAESLSHTLVQYLQDH